MNRDQVFIERAKRSHPRIAGMERQLVVLPPSRLRDQLFRNQERLLEQLNDENPCLPLPPGAFDGQIGIAVDQRTQTPLRVAHTDLATHTIVLGTTGSGKTSSAAYITKNIADHNPEVKISYFDPKSDYRKRAVDDPRCIPITRDILFNFLRPPSFMEREQYHALFFDVFGRSHWAGHQQIGILKEATRAAYANNPDPNIDDIVNALRPMMTRENTYNQRDKAGEVRHKLTEFQRLIPGIYHAKGHCLTMEELTSRPVYWPLVPGDTYEFLFTLWLLSLFYRNAANHTRNTLDSMIVIDESLSIFSEHAANLEGTPLLDRAISTMREMGIGLLFTTSSWRTITPHVRNNANIQIAMLTTDGIEAEELRRTFQLTTTEFAAYQRLRPLDCLLRVPARWPYAVLATVPPFPATEKLVGEAEWQRIARERQQALLPPPPITPTIATPITPIPPAAPPPVVPIMPVALSHAQEALMQAVADLAMPMSTEAYRTANLTLQSGDRAAKHTEAIGMLTRNPVIARNGRGGKAIGLRLTPAGYERLGRTPPHTLRGGSSPQHTYTVVNIARHIPDARIEATLGGVCGKSIDILFRITTAHDRILQVIAHNAHYLCENPVSTNPGDLVALEVEASMDAIDARKTAIKNATADLNAGVAIVIIATMQKTLAAITAALQQELPTPTLPRVILTDALALLKDIQEDKS